MRSNNHDTRVLYALAMVLVGATQARAALITYTTDLQVGGMSVPSLTTTIMPPGLGTASATVTPIGGGPLDIAFTPTVIPFGMMAVDTSAFAVFTPIASAAFTTGGFNLFLTLTDVATSQSGTLQFLGGVGGSVFTAPPGGMFSRITVNYTPLIGVIGQARTVQVGDTLYDVTLLFSGASLISNQLTASSNFQVAVAQSVPEPASLMLVGVGLVAGAWRMRLRRTLD
jgi:hypothetical protein